MPCLPRHRDKQTPCSFPQACLKGIVLNLWRKKACDMLCLYLCSQLKTLVPVYTEHLLLVVAAMKVSVLTCSRQATHTQSAESISPFACECLIYMCLNVVTEGQLLSPKQIKPDSQLLTVSCIPCFHIQVEIGDDGCLHLPADATAIQHALCSLDLDRARLLTQLSGLQAEHVRCMLHGVALLLPHFLLYCPLLFATGLLLTAHILHLPFCL